MRPPVAAVRVPPLLRPEHQGVAVAVRRVRDEQEKRQVPHRNERPDAVPRVIPKRSALPPPAFPSHDYREVVPQVEPERVGPLVVERLPPPHVAVRRRLRTYPLPPVERKLEELYLGKCGQVLGVYPPDGPGGPVEAVGRKTEDGL